MNASHWPLAHYHRGIIKSHFTGQVVPFFDLKIVSSALNEYELIIRQIYGKIFLSLTTQLH